jgi:hypothetical protein
MSYRDDDDSGSSVDSLLGDIAHKHTPDSVREEAYRELQEKHGISHREAQQKADQKFGDFWG